MKVFDYYYRSRIAKKLRSRRGELALRSGYFPKLKVIYIPCPKVAGSSIFATLIKADSSPHLVGITDHNLIEARRLLSAEYEPRAFWRALYDPRWTRFAFVRDPYTRIVSCFLDKIASGETSRFKSMLGFSANQPVSLLAFLRGIAEQKTDAMNRHWRPQSALISPKVDLDFLGRFERFDEDFTKFREMIGVPYTGVTARVHHKTSASTHLDLVGPDEKALIKQIYRDDFERFGYAR